MDTVVPLWYSDTLEEVGMDMKVDKKPTQEALDKLQARKNWTICSDYERWTKQRVTNVKVKRKERRKHDRP